MHIEIENLLDDICGLKTAGYPFLEMEQLIALGGDAVQPVLDCLSGREGTPEVLDELPLIVVLGELRSSLAVGTLLSRLKDTGNYVIATAAAEALGKTGDPAVAPLEAFVRGEADLVAQVYGYGALGYLRLPAARAFLLERLETDPELADVIAYAIALSGSREDAERIFRVYERSADTCNPEFEEAISLSACPDRRGKTPLDEDWRIRYRRLPEQDFRPAPVPLDVMAHLHEQLREGRAPGSRRTGAKKKFEEILASVRTEPDRRDKCPSCGEEPRNRTGIPACSEDAYGLMLFQRGILKHSMESYCDTLPQAYDFLDNVYESAMQTRNEEQQDIYRIGTATLDYFVGRRIYRLADAVVKLEDITRIFTHEYEQQHGVHPAFRAAGSPEPCSCGHDHEHDHAHGHEHDKVGRNDLCPCGSGKKYKKCCGAGKE